MHDHFIDALAAKNNGAVDNGTITPIRGENRRTTSPTPFGPVSIKRAAIHGWSCDDCHTLGSGWYDIENHFERTGHAKYTEMR